ncbi:hypothetical protein NW754_016131 [Fusarium falciforme]|nr:hypothetical protein NW754_016131 [Fusarium falciforme]
MVNSHQRQQPETGITHPGTGTFPTTGSFLLSQLGWQGQGIRENGEKLLDSPVAPQDLKSFPPSLSSPAGQASQRLQSLSVSLHHVGGSQTCIALRPAQLAGALTFPMAARKVQLLSRDG